jgi:hypothetical protein
MKILFACGNSQTSGSYPNSPNTYNKDKVWAKYLASELNLEYLNLARPGASSEEISMYTTVGVHNLISKYNKNPSEILVTVLWDVNFQKRLTWIDGEHRSVDTEKGSKDYCKYLNLYYIYTTSIFLERYGIPYLFLNTEPIVSPSDPKILELYKNILYLYGDRSNNHLGFFDKEDSFDFYLSSRTTPMATGRMSYAYWDESAHNLYANFILNKIKNETKMD